MRKTSLVVGISLLVLIWAMGGMALVLLLRTGSARKAEAPAPVPPVVKPIEAPMEPMSYQLGPSPVPLKTAKYHIMLYSGGGMVIGDWTSTGEPEPRPGNLISFTDAETNREILISGTFIMEEVKEKYKPKGP